MIVCRENLHHAQELQKRAHNKGVKPRSYAPGDKVWLNSKYIKTKRNRKLEAKFFGPFRVLHPVGKQAYKLELPRKWKIHDVHHKLSLLENSRSSSSSSISRICLNVKDPEIRLNILSSAGLKFCCNRLTNSRHLCPSSAATLVRVSVSQYLKVVPGRYYLPGDTGMT